MIYKILEKTIKYCKNCGIEFHPLTPHQQFCSKECKREYTLKIRRERYKNPLKKLHYCIQCGKQMDVYGSQKFCSIECRNIHRKQVRNKTGRICNRIIKPNILKKCEYCGKDIPWIKERASLYNKRKFCSKKCCSEYFKHHNKNFEGRQKNIEEFKIIINKHNNKFVWKAIKNNKIVLISDQEFISYKDCLKDAKSAF